MPHLTRLALALALVLSAGLGLAQRSLEDLKIAFLYVGPVGDYGFSYAHDLGRRALVEHYPGLETTFIESVPEAEVEPFVDQLVADGHNVIIAPASASATACWPRPSATPTSSSGTPPAWSAAATCSPSWPTSGRSTT